MVIAIRRVDSKTEPYDVFASKEAKSLTDLSLRAGKTGTSGEVVFIACLELAVHRTSSFSLGGLSSVRQTLAEMERKSKKIAMDAAIVARERKTFEDHFRRIEDAAKELQEQVRFATSSVSSAELVGSVFADENGISLSAAGRSADLNDIQIVNFAADTFEAITGARPHNGHKPSFKNFLQLFLCFPEDKARKHAGLWFDRN